jgi:CRISPR-associated endonuclease/helicase Cas3
MNILLIAQCSKNALIESRRILDQFAERRGDRTWQTAITQQGLDTLYRLLRRSARKNTAVACHWIRGKDHSELLWIVGDARQFNESGAVPTNTTRRNILRSQDENDWHAAEDMRTLVRLAALLHDLGKANDAFQTKIRTAADKAVADAFRHEWLSLRLFQAFVARACEKGGRNDQAWLESLTQLDGSESAWLIEALQAKPDGRGDDSYPFDDLQDLPLARAVAWLMLSHHLLPDPSRDAQFSDKDLERHLNWLNHAWCGSRLPGPGENKPPAKAGKNKAQVDPVAACWQFSRGLSFASPSWRRYVAKAARALLQRPNVFGQEGAKRLHSPYVLHLARMALILADHYYSSLPSQSLYGEAATTVDNTLYANTLDKKDRVPKQPPVKQRLDEHLIGVSINADRLLRALPRLDTSLARITRHKDIRRPSCGAYSWQNKAFYEAEGLAERSSRQGFFGINLASTGCGKTMANARILYGLSNARLGCRFTVALGLRNLTLQTGDAYRERLRLTAEDLAILVGGTAKALHEHWANKELPSVYGSESSADLLPEHSHVRFEGSLEDGPLNRWLHPDPQDGQRRQRRQQAVALLDAPVVVCTIDHLMPATESLRGGQHILPMLRLMTSDLILDEPDDFGLEDLPALSRLVHWAGLLGSRVLLSSATLPPALVQGLFNAYCAGRQEFNRYRGRPGEPHAVCCAWFDEFDCQSNDYRADWGGFLEHHHAFIAKRLTNLARKNPPRRRASLIPTGVGQLQGVDQADKLRHLCQQLAPTVLQRAQQLHHWHYSIDPVSGKRVSFGLIRMANINPLFNLARQLYALGAPAGVRIHLCVYHARHPLPVRSAMEHILDACLDRKESEAVFRQADVRTALDAYPEHDQLFIVLATAVAEVGRDHDYDWAIVDPSSMRSLIQLAGRVWRHRLTKECTQDRPNLFVLDTNVRHLRYGMAQPAYCRPGFEAKKPEDGSAGFYLNSHDLNQLLKPELGENSSLVVDAQSRIQAREELRPNDSLADLEHASLADIMLGADGQHIQQAKPAPWWWERHAHLSAYLQRKTPFRKDELQHQSYVLRPNDDAVDFELCLIQADGDLKAAAGLTRLKEKDFPHAEGIAPWATPDYLATVHDLSESLGEELEHVAKRHGRIDLYGDAWLYHPWLGFDRKG